LDSLHKQLRANSIALKYYIYSFILFRTLEQIQGYFVWSKAVIDQIRGTNKGLEAALDQVFASSFTWNGNKYPCVPEGDLQQQLDKYYSAIEGKK
jgi:hypothetical protein